MSQETLDINEAATFLKIGQSTLLELAEAGSIPGGKISRSWVFLKEDLVTWMREQFADQQRERIANITDGKKGKILTVVSKTKGKKRREPPELPELSGQVASA